MPTFEITVAEPYMLEGFSRHRRCSKLARYMTAARVSVVLIFVVAWIVVFVPNPRSVRGIVYGAIALTPLLLYFLFARRLERWLVARRVRRSPSRGDRVRLQLSPDGLTATGTKSSAQLTWAAFSAARRFDDGFLLLQGPGFARWLPDSAITAGSAAEAEELIRKNISDYQCV